MTDHRSQSARRSSFAAAGILFTRLLGFVRQRVFAHYFGVSAEADAFTAALRIPGIVRNLLGEGTLSASFVPVYAGLLEKEDHDGARRLASNAISVLAIAAGIAALVGVLFAHAITRLVASGFDPATSELTARIVRILFPMGAVMVLSSWCLGILNAHRKFFLSYAAPALWNVAQIGVLIALGATLAGADLVMALAWGALGGGLLQFVVQLPATLRLVSGLRWAPSLQNENIRTVVRNWIPMVFGAGVFQLSTLIDVQLASRVPEVGAMAALGYAQMIALLPASLFGVSVAAVALPELSRDATTGDVEAFRERMGDGVQRLLFYILPTTAVLIWFGPQVVGPILQTGAFGVEQTIATSAVLCMLGIGLPARSMVRLVTSGHYAHGDTRTPVRIATVTMIIGAGLSFWLMQSMGVAGIALGGSIAAYVNVSSNFVFMRKHLSGILGDGVGFAIVGALLGTGLATGAGWFARNVTQDQSLLVTSAATLTTAALVYLGVTFVVAHPEARRVLRRS